MREALPRTHQGAVDRYPRPVEPQHCPPALLPSMSSTFVSCTASEGGLYDGGLIGSKGRLKSMHKVRQDGLLPGNVLQMSAAQLC